MSEIKFADGDLVRIQGKEFMVLGARLRIAHQVFKDRISITTEVIDHVLEQQAVVRARVVVPAGEFTATATASAARDARLVQCLLEVAEARSVARALRYSGIGVEFVGHEELGDGPVLEGEAVRQELRSVPGRVNGGTQTGGNGSRGTPCTAAQRRALQSLSRQIGQELEQVVAKVYPGTDSDHLTLPQASALIDKMRAKAGNGAGAGR